MALAFPKTNATVLAPLGAVGVYWAWFGLSPKRAFLVGWAAGSVFFAINYSWFGETAGALIAPFGFFLTLGPAIGDAAFAFALPACAIALIRDRTSPALLPLASAAVFAFAEWFRCEGLGQLGVPFGSLGYTQVATPLAPLAADVGTYGITFVLMLLAAYAAQAIRSHASPASLRAFGIAAGCVVVALAASWLTWPARNLAAPAIPVAAVQGNIAQSLKFTDASIRAGITRYAALTEGLRGRHPRIVLWPETVIVKALNKEPALQARFANLARALNAELVVGTFEVTATEVYNTLFFFRPDGTLDAVYRKRQLVPFAEHLPFKAFLSWIPWASQVSNLGIGDTDGVIEAGGFRVAPIVCWESAFSGLVSGDVRDGATLLLIATDDAWFGKTAGPYQHAQIAQMRALETGRWVLRAASTGVSGIIAPNGRYVAQTQLEETAVLNGNVGRPVDTFYDAFGPAPLALVFALVFGAIAFAGRSRPF
ncbi:MAG: apolipoprotein N-acyltransferase [Candidatus Eremiobacteraeota bacterium]|nr:apolipoprotein N-acyltransferase [Candidatus Eremiobacteraeota bacterium]